MEPHPHRNHYRLIILTLFVGLALITIALVFYYQRSGMLRVPAAVSTQSAPVSIPTTKPTTPKKAGTTEMRFDCRGNNVSDTSKININFSSPQNVIDCSSTAANVLTINVTQPGPEATPTPEGGQGTVPPGAYVPGNTTLTPTPSGLPNSGFFDNTLYYIISGGALMSLGGVMHKLYARPF
jgi:hypothetical protein